MKALTNKETSSNEKKEVDQFHLSNESYDRLG